MINVLTMGGYCCNGNRWCQASLPRIFFSGHLPSITRELQLSLRKFSLYLSNVKCLMQDMTLFYFIFLVF